MGSRDICVGHFCHPVLCVTVGVWLTPYAVKIGLHMSALKLMSFSWRIFTFPFRIFIEPWCSNNWTVSRKYSKFWRRSKMKHLIKIQFILLQSNTRKIIRRHRSLPHWFVQLLEELLAPKVSSKIQNQQTVELRKTGKSLEQNQTSPR